MATQTSASPSSTGLKREERRVLAGTLVGTSIEWYDFFIYAQAAGLVLAPLFLAPLAESDPAIAQVLFQQLVLREPEEDAPAATR